MIFDKILFSKLKIVGKALLRKSGLMKPPQNIQQMYIFLNTTAKLMNQYDFAASTLGNVLYSFVSDILVRDRLTTSRIFEDIFSNLFNLNATDKRSRKNPEIPDFILKYDVYTTKEDWKISTDMSMNKREKADIILGNYAISLKTLKGTAYDENMAIMPKTIIDSSGKEIVNKDNDEVNVGSFSFRALLKGILTDEELSVLGDRKKGLGSKSAFRANVLNPIIKHEKENEFAIRLEEFMNYVYTDDIYIILKGNYQMKFILIPSESFRRTIIKTYKEDNFQFEYIWSRWENNNLRMNWKPLLRKMKEYEFNYYEIVLKLNNAVNNPKILDIEKMIENYIEYLFTINIGGND